MGTARPGMSCQPLMGVGGRRRQRDEQMEEVKAGLLWVGGGGWGEAEGESISQLW